MYGVWRFRNKKTYILSNTFYTALRNVGEQPLEDYKHNITHNNMIERLPFSDLYDRDGRGDSSVVQKIDLQTSIWIESI